MEVKDAEVELIEVIAELDAKIDVLSIQTVPEDIIEDITVADDESWRHTNVFSTMVACRGQSHSLFIYTSNALNGVLQYFVDQLWLSYDATCEFISGHLGQWSQDDSFTAVLGEL